MTRLLFTTSIDDHKHIGEMRNLTPHDAAICAVGNVASTFGDLITYPVVVQLYTPEGMAPIARFQVQTALTATQLEASR